MRNYSNLAESSWWNLRASALLAAVACVFQSLLPAQQPATISGFVAGHSGAGVPNASVALVNQDTTVVVITTKSDSNGNLLDFGSDRRLYQVGTKKYYCHFR